MREVLRGTENTGRGISDTQLRASKIEKLRRIKKIKNWLKKKLKIKNKKSGVRRRKISL